VRVNRIEGMEREGAIHNTSGNTEEGVQNSVLFSLFIVDIERKDFICSHKNEGASRVYLVS
jgi:hypothetical protein